MGDASSDLSLGDRGPAKLLNLARKTFVCGSNMTASSLSVAGLAGASDGFD